MDAKRFSFYMDLFFHPFSIVQKYGRRSVDLHGKSVSNSYIWLQKCYLTPSQNLIEWNDFVQSHPHVFPGVHQCYARERIINVDFLRT